MNKKKTSSITTPFYLFPFKNKIFYEKIITKLKKKTKLNKKKHIIIIFQKFFLVF